MQAPLRRGREETLGRANGVKRTGRSLLFGLLVVGLISISSIVYTSERLLVEGMLKENLALEGARELARTRTDRLEFDVAALASLARITKAASADSSMALLDWKDVVVIDERVGGRK
jgi:hypothetical protein